MHTRLSDVYLNHEINEKIEDACENLGISKSMFLNVLLQELFSKAGPEDLFYNRVKLCNDSEMTSKTATKQITH
ncbi:hypothetical protein [Desulfovibrio sp. JC010]|uniref:hypothetical protein n=1 Tax=Desulfovibrio sp. JC010 TaxID=2593641 RepID=UPI0013D1E541|nr:hypothetical protein [Desulfovibrio sp. JC010]NDV26519.1 hypothetical protein [Desulfovibrio sp. JC010]